MGQYGLKSCGSRQWPMVGVCKQGNGPEGSKKTGL
jgi:hypothetical protein